MTDGEDGGIVFRWRRAFLLSTTSTLDCVAGGREL